MKNILLVLIIFVTVVSCSSDDGDELQKELNRNRQLWASKKIDNYKWSERLSCFCGGVLDRDIFVMNKEKDTVRFDNIVLPANVNFNEIYEQVFNDSKTIEDAFGFIEELLTQEAESLVIEYEQSYGFPTLISVDYDFQIADDEFVYNYANFEIIN